MPKKYISFLGTGIYQECKYRHDDYTSEKVRFIQQANLDKLFNHDKTFGPEDKVVILLTEKSEQLNWVDGGQKDRETDEPLKDKETNEPLKGLKTCIDNLNLPAEVELKKNTPVGNSEAEIMEIFTILYDSVDEGDELYLDITHAFRFMPMVLVVLGNYVKLLKNATVASITYGNYEGRDEDKNEAPVIELKQLSVIQDWTLAAGQFINCGSAEDLKAIANEQIMPILKESDYKDANAIAIKNFVRKIYDMVTNFSLCQGLDVVNAKDLVNARENLKAIEKVAIAPLDPIINKIGKSLDALGDKDNAMNGMAAAKWCREHGLYQQAATAALETVITVVSGSFKTLEVKWDERRNAVNRAISIIKGKEGIERTELVNAVLEKLQDVPGELIDKYADGADKCRNYLNHFGMRPQVIKTSALRDSVDKFVDVCDQLCNNFLELTSDAPQGEVSPLFINISNHPSDKWSAAQKAATGAEIVDIPFPIVDPNLGEEELDEIADGIIVQVLNLAKDHSPITAHVMGEMTLTMRLVGRLNYEGVTCVAATTNRDVVENPDGTRTVMFNFVRFRKY